MTRRGFTLIEVMAALAVLGLAVFMLLDAHYGGLRLHDAARERVVLYQLLTHAVGVAKTEVAGGTLAGSGDYGVRFEKYAYRFEASCNRKSGPACTPCVWPSKARTRTMSMRRWS
jgi:prepilin-type N-terminal cleavage/methylation domain-containing protein